MEKNYYLTKAIYDLSIAISYLTWAIESQEEKTQIEWTSEVINKIADAKRSIDNSDILPF